MPITDRDTRVGRDARALPASVPIPVSAEPTLMTDEQKFVFDLKGWILLPGILEPALVHEIRAQLERDARSAGANKAVYRTSILPPAQELVDHPAIVGILRQIVGPDVSPACYGFRCESSFFVYRGFGQAGFQPAHRGPADSPLAYRAGNGRIASGLTRVMWELVDVEQPEGGTAIMSGSHKANFDVPERFRRYDPALYEGYTCPAGSAVVFTESCWHYGVQWRDPSRRRLAVFNCYNHYLSNFHRPHVSADVIAAMPAKRQTAFRGIWGFDSHRQVFNDFYDENNVAL